MIFFFKLYFMAKSSVILGVCGKLAAMVGVDATIMRVIFVVLALCGGIGILGYLILWLVLMLLGK